MHEDSTHKWNKNFKVHLLYMLAKKTHPCFLLENPIIASFKEIIVIFPPFKPDIYKSD